jgi:diaminopimelate decarboxylase
VSGLAVHIGSQLTDLNPYKKTFIKIAHLIEGLKDNGHEIKRLDLGGGIGIAYSDDTKVINLEEYAATVKSIFGHFDCEFEFEPGRFIVGNAGLFVCSVIYFKNLKSRNFLVLDGAMNDLMRPAMYDAYHEVVPVRQRKTSSIVKVDIVGPICETADTFARDRELPFPSEGDLVAFRSAGAYGAVMSSEYNSRPLIPEVLVKDSKFSIIRARPSIKSIIERDVVPDWLF